MYTFETLPTDGSIRLFVLKRGTGKQPLRGSLYTCKLDDAPDFEGISYVWGSQDRCVELTCDGQQIFITQSLSDVLYRVRLPGRARTLWTDLICINQDDLDEKGHQVSLMGSIYRRCHRTLIHIGTRDDGHGVLVQGLLRDIDQGIFANLPQEWDSAPFIERDHPLVNDGRWNSIRQMIETPWFYRGWVVQEAAYAHCGVVLWGDHEISWTVIMRTLMWVLRRAFSTILQKFNLSISHLHVSSFSLLRKHEVQPLMSEAFWGNYGKVLSSFHFGRTHQLADPRDRIYAFYDLPASDRSSKLRMTPDYHKSFPEVCKDFALHYLDVYDDLDLLLYVIHDDESLNGGIPSWIPRWDTTIHADESFRSIHADDPPLIEKHEARFSFRGDSSDLRVSGLIFAKVRMLSVVLSGEWLTFEGIARLWSEVCDVQKPIISAESRRFAMFLVTLRFGLQGLDVDYEMDLRGEAAITLEVFNILTGQAKRSINPMPSEQQASGGDAQMILRQIRRFAENRRFILTGQGYGMGPAIAREGDECVILRGGKTPFLLRKADGVGNYKFIGPIAHSSKYTIVSECTGWHGGALLWKNTKDWEDWDVEEEEFYIT